MQTAQTSLSIRSPTQQLELHDLAISAPHSHDWSCLRSPYLKTIFNTTSTLIARKTVMAETAPAPAATPATSAPAAPAGGATAGAQNTPADQNAASRGLPYYEKLRRELRDTIAHKRAMDRSMVSARFARSRAFVVAGNPSIGCNVHAMGLKYSSQLFLCLSR